MSQEFMNVYTSGEYLEKNPTWHVEDSPWKAKQILKLMKRNHLSPKTICEVGCGAGEILRQLQMSMGPECEFYGYEISSQAFELCKSRQNEKLHFELKDIIKEKDVSFDIILLIDIIEHLEDYFTFLRQVKSKARYKILHIPLDLSLQILLRVTPLWKLRPTTGHLHFFTKEWALEILKDTGYEIIDSFYTPGTIDLPSASLKRHIAKLPRKLFFKIHADLAVRVLGGYSLMVLAS
jgi:Methyltransferase domain